MNKIWLIGQTHDSKGNVANYHAVKTWPCVMGGCSRSRLPMIVLMRENPTAICRVTYSGGQTMTRTADGTSKFHVNKYFNTVTAVQMSNRRQWIIEIR